VPFHDFEYNRVWPAIVRIANDLIAWTQRLLLTGELARAEPKRLRYRLLHVAGLLPFHARTATLRSKTTGPGPQISPPRSRRLTAPKRLARASPTSHADYEAPTPITSRSI